MAAKAHLENQDLWYQDGLILEPFGDKAHIDVSINLNKKRRPAVVADAHNPHRALSIVQFVALRVDRFQDQPEAVR